MVELAWNGVGGGEGGGDGGGDGGGGDGGGGDGGGDGGMYSRGPQSAQSLPYGQLLPSAPGPPSLQKPLDAQGHASEQIVLVVASGRAKISSMSLNGE